MYNRNKYMSLLSKVDQCGPDMPKMDQYMPKMDQ